MSYASHSPCFVFARLCKSVHKLTAYTSTSSRPTFHQHHPSIVSDFIIEFNSALYTCSGHKSHVVSQLLFRVFAYYTISSNCIHESNYIWHDPVLNNMQM